MAIGSDLCKHEYYYYLAVNEDGRSSARPDVPSLSPLRGYVRDPLFRLPFGWY